MEIVSFLCLFWPIWSCWVRRRRWLRCYWLGIGVWLTCLCWPWCWRWCCWRVRWLLSLFSRMFRSSSWSRCLPWLRLIISWLNALNVSPICCRRGWWLPGRSWSFWRVLSRCLRFGRFLYGWYRRRRLRSVHRGCKLEWGFWISIVRLCPTVVVCRLVLRRLHFSWWSRFLLFPG